MAFNSREEFVNRQASEKVLLAHVEANQRVYNWTIHSGNIYVKTVSYFVVDVKQTLTYLTAVDDIGSMVEGSWYYDPATNNLYVWSVGDVDPGEEETIVWYRFFFSNKTLSCSYDLTDTGTEVNYNGRIKSAPKFKSKIGIEQGLSSLVGEGNLVLYNTDGGLDQIYDTLYFENKNVNIYSWNQDLPFSSAKIIYRGKVTNKHFDDLQVTFTIKDAMFDLQQSLPMVEYDENDGVNEDIIGRFKRWVYGRVDGLQIQSTDMIGEGYLITGTVSGNKDSDQLNGIGTSFLSEVSPEDTLIINGVEYTVDTIQSDTLLTLDSIIELNIGQTQAIIQPEIPVTTKNRDFLVTGHACSTVTHTFLQAVTANRVELDSIVGLRIGDFLEFDNGERIAIRNFAPSNIVVLQEALTSIPSVSTDVVRQPVQNVYVDGVLTQAADFSITNVGAPTNECRINISTDVEFNIAPRLKSNVSLNFVNGSREITYGGTIDLTTIFTTRDWIRPTELTFTTWYEILQVSENTITLRTPFTDPNHSGFAEYKHPNYIGDESIISADVLGRTVDGEPEGAWITTAAQTNRDVLTQLNMDFVNEATFTAAAEHTPALVSLALPVTIGGSVPSGKLVTDYINKSTFSALALDNDLRVQYVTLVYTVDNPQIITDKDTIRWVIKGVNGKAFKTAYVNYRFMDVDNTSLDNVNSIFTFNSPFIEKYIETTKSNESDIYLYDDLDAEIYAHRHTLFNQLSRSDIRIESDLRLENIAVGDVVIIEFDRLYNRLGDVTSRKKLAMVIGKTVDGERTILDLSDFGNIFNAVSVITPNDALTYSLATELDKLVYGYITANNGLTGNDENTVNVHKII